jgi:hypothetical protein
MVSWFINLLLEKDKINKHLLSSTLPKTMAIESSMSFSHSNNYWKIKLIINYILASNAHIFEHGLQFVCGFIAATTLDLIIILKKEVYSSNWAS